MHIFKETLMTCFLNIQLEKNWFKTSYNLCTSKMHCLCISLSQRKTSIYTFDPLDVGDG